MHRTWKLTQEIPFGNHHSHFISITWEIASSDAKAFNKCERRLRSWLPDMSWTVLMVAMERASKESSGGLSWEAYPTFQRWEYEPFQYTYTYHRDTGWKISTRFVKQILRVQVSQKIYLNLRYQNCTYTIKSFEMWPSVAKFWYGCARWNRPEALMNDNLVSWAFHGCREMHHPGSYCSYH